MLRTPSVRLAGVPSDSGSPVSDCCSLGCRDRSSSLGWSGERVGNQEPHLQICHPERTLTLSFAKGKRSRRTCGCFFCLERARPQPRRQPATVSSSLLPGYRLSPMDESLEKIVRTSDPNWLRTLALLYRARQAGVLIDDAGLGINPEDQTLLQMARVSGLSRREIAS